MFGKLGAAENKVSLTATRCFNGDSKTEVYAGVGGQYNLNQKVALTAGIRALWQEQGFRRQADVFTVGRA